MKPDLLDEATAAYRDATHEAAGDRGLDRFERSLDRVVHPTHKRRVSWLVLPLAAALLAGSAWAGATGALQRWFGGHDEIAAPTPPATPTPPAPAPSPTAPSVPAEVSTGLATEPSVMPPVLPALTPRVAVPNSAPRPTVAPGVSVGPAPVAPAAVDLDALYREAHEAQFGRRDPNAALAAWNRYLGNADPSARLLLEARYNRALVLRDLGRNAEARAALQPFAEGDYGGYRRDDASRLLQSLP